MRAPARVDKLAKSADLKSVRLRALRVRPPPRALRRALPACEAVQAARDRAEDVQAQAGGVVAVVGLDRGDGGADGDARAVLLGRPARRAGLKGERGAQERHEGREEG